jgi:HlyD family secretion protein
VTCRAGAAGAEFKAACVRCPYCGTGADRSRALHARHRLPRNRSVFAVRVVPVLAGTLLTAACSHPNAFAYSGTLQAESAQVGSDIGGRVVEVPAADGQRVQRGQLLVALDDTQQRAQLAAARESLAQAQAEQARAEAVLQGTVRGQPQQLRAARAAVRRARALLHQALAQQQRERLTYVRVESLFAQGAVAAQARDDARASYESSVAAVAAARAQVASATAVLTENAKASLPQAVSVARQAVESASAAVAAARAQVAAAQSRLAEMTVRAPADGIVDSLDLRPGDLVGPQAVVASVLEFLNPYVRIYVAQRDLGRLRVGRHVRVRSDAVPGKTFDGIIEQIDDQAQFTPRDVETSEDRANLTFGVKVRVIDPRRELHPGTTVEVAL